jgi:hypothetical protein
VRPCQAHAGIPKMAQPVYVTSSSTGAAVFKTVNWHVTPQQISFAVISSGGSSWAIAVCYEDPSFTYPSPQASITAGSSSITTFSLATGSANAFVALPSSMTPIAGFSFSLSTAVGKVTCVLNQAGVV